MLQTTSPLQMINDDGRRFHARLVRRKEYYGADSSLLYQSAEPLVELFDVSSNGADDSDQGYHTGISFKISTLFETAFECGGYADTLFNESLPMWNISLDNVESMKAWLLRNLQPEEKSFINKAALSIAAQTDGENNTGIAGKTGEAPALCAVPAPPHLLPQGDDTQDYLKAALHNLDAAEQLSGSLDQRNISLRMKIIEAKKQVLEALEANIGTIHKQEREA